MRKLIPLFVPTFLLYLAASYFSAPLTSFDAVSYSHIGNLTLKGISIYPDPAISRHPYFPLFLYLEAAAQFISPLVRLPQIFILKIVFSLFHLASIYLVYHLAKKNLTTAWTYALNPISLLIIAIHGQFDIIPLFLILLSIFLLQKKEYAKVMFFFGLAFTVKTWPILFIIPFLKRTPKKYWIWFLLSPLVTVFVYGVLFRASLVSVARVLAVYQGVGGVWGLGKLIYLATRNKIVLFVCKVIFVLGLGLYSLRQKKKPLIEEVFAVMFIFFIFTPGFGIQWLLWLIPFFFLTKKPYMYVFMAAILIGLCVTYLSWFPSSLITMSMAQMALLGLWPVFVLYYGLFFLLSRK